MSSCSKEKGDSGIATIQQTAPSSAQQVKHRIRVRSYPRNQLVCAVCGVSSTYIQRKHKGKQVRFPLWHWNVATFEDEPVCHNCYMRMVIAPKNNPRRMKYKDKTIYLEKNPRTGYCSNPKCPNKGQKVKTDIHHREYHDDDPLKDTEERCDHCHKLDPKSWREDDAMKAVAEMFSEELLK